MNPYEILGVSPTADLAAIKAAWRALARKWHPDRRGGDDRRMGEINAAYAVLSDPTLRERFDLSGEDGMVGPPPVDVKARQALMQIIVSRLTNDQFTITNIADWCTRNIQHNLDEKSALQKKCVRKADQARKARANAKFTESGEALIGGVFDQVIEGYDKQASDLQEIIDVMTRAREMLHDLMEFAHELPNPHIDAHGRKKDPIMQWLEGRTQMGPGPL